MIASKTTGRAPARRRLGNRTAAGQRKGAMLALIALLLPVVLLFMGFAVDLAYMQTTRMELRAAADAAARAGATALSQTDNQTLARQTAQQIARQNDVAGQPLLLADSNVEIGRSVQQGTGKWTFAAGGSPANSVRVTAPRTAGSRSGGVNLFFGSLIGRRQFEPVMQATASFLNFDICLVLDRSTSMKLDVTGQTGGMYTSDPRFCAPAAPTSRWLALDAAVRVFIDELEQGGGDNKVALASYSSDLTAVLGNVCGASRNPASLDARLDSDLARVESALSSLTSSVWNGNTYIEAGMLKGVEALTDSSRTRVSAQKVMIVMTDGNENVGSASAAAAVAAASNITIHTITFSDDANATLMRNVASIGAGQYYHANTAEQLRDVFKKLAAVVSGLTQ